MSDDDLLDVSVTLSREEWETILRLVADNSDIAEALRNAIVVRREPRP